MQAVVDAGGHAVHDLSPGVCPHPVAQAEADLRAPLQPPPSGVDRQAEHLVAEDVERELLLHVPHLLNPELGGGKKEKWSKLTRILE